MNSNQKMINRVKNTIELEIKLDVDQNLKNNIVVLTFVLCDKFLSNQEISEIWRDYKMVRIFKYAKEQGKKKGKIEDLSKKIITSDSKEELVDFLKH